MRGMQVSTKLPNTSHADQANSTIASVPIPCGSHTGETTNKARSTQLAPNTTSSARVIPETENSSGASRGARLSSLLIFAGTATRDFCARASRMPSPYFQAIARRIAARRRYAAPWTYCRTTIEPIATLNTARNARALGM